MYSATIYKNMEFVVFFCRRTEYFLDVRIRLKWIFNPLAPELFFFILAHPVYKR